MMYRPSLSRNSCVWLQRLGMRGEQVRQHLNLKAQHSMFVACKAKLALLGRLQDVSQLAFKPQPRKDANATMCDFFGDTRTQVSTQDTGQQEQENNNLEGGGSRRANKAEIVSMPNVQPDWKTGRLPELHFEIMQCQPRCADILYPFQAFTCRVYM